MFICKLIENRKIYYISLWLMGGPVCYTQYWQTILIRTRITHLVSIIRGSSHSHALNLVRPTFMCFILGSEFRRKDKLLNDNLFSIQ